MSCPMSFGEINIPSSRAFWDDCDEDEVPTEETIEKLKLIGPAGDEVETIASDLMLLLEGPNISEFAENILLNEATEKICSIPSKNSSIHYNKSKKLLLIIIEEDLTMSGALLEVLIPFAKAAQKVVAVALKSKIDYKSENIEKIADEITFLRGINTQVANVKELEAPNFVSGLAAGVASWRESMKLPVSCYIAYTDNIRMDSLAAEPILHLISKDLGIPCAASYKYKERDESHLYL